MANDNRGERREKVSRSFGVVMGFFLMFYMAFRNLGLSLFVAIIFGFLSINI